MSSNPKVTRITKRSSEIPGYSRQVLLESENDITSCDLLDFSPFGLGVQCEKDTFPKYIAAGAMVRVKLKHNDNFLNLRAKVSSISELADMHPVKLRIGFEIIKENEAIVGMRQGKRFFIDPNVTLRCSASDPAAPGEALHFIIKDFSGGGILLQTSARNKFIFPGGRVNLHILLSDTEVLKEDVIVRHIQSAETVYLVGCSFVRLSDDSLEKIVSFYLTNSPTELLLERQKEVKVLFEDLRVKRTSMPYEVLQIISLRNQRTKNKSVDALAKDPWLSWDERDLKSQHLLVKYKSRVIGACCLFLLGKDPKLTGGIDHRFIELSKIRIDQSFIDTSAYLSLWIGILSFQVEAKVPYMLWRNDSASLQSHLPRKLGILPPFDQDNVSVMSLDNLLYPTQSDFIAWSCIIAPLLEKDPVFRQKIFPARFFVARIIKKLFLKRFLSENHLQFVVSVQ